MSTGLSFLQAYDSDDSSNDDAKTTADETSTKASTSAAANADSQSTEEFKFEKIDPSLSLVSSIKVESAPLVAYSVRILS